MRIEETLKYLGGGCLVYAVVAACGSGGGRTAMDAGSDAASSGVGGIGGVAGSMSDAMGAADVTGRPDGMLTDATGAMDATLDQGRGDVTSVMDALTDPVPDAMAQEAGTCGTCSVSGPVTVQGSVLTADTDAAQLRSGTASANPSLGSRVFDGPFVLTDALGTTGSVILFIQPAGDCSFSSSSTPIARFSQNSHITGAKFLVAAGRSLCSLGVSNNEDFSWSGFVPY